MRWKLAMTVGLSTLAAAAVAAPVGAPSASLEAALKASTRSPANVARDRYRHPAETLAFFGLKPGMTVVEIAPGAGWYTEVLAPAIGAKGKLILAGPDPDAGDRQAAAAKRLQAKLDANPAYKNTTIYPVRQGTMDVAPAGSADMVVTFRNVHNWMADGSAEKMFTAFYRALKPGGVLGLEEHRLPENRTQDPKGETGYVKESVVIAMAEKAGFKLAGRSDVNRNPKDTADYPKGVWTLPPNYAEGAATKAKYDAIGESDRMTLKFVKPR
jgi:predicted methyltransferase